MGGDCWEGTEESLNRSVGTRTGVSGVEEQKMGKEPSGGATSLPEAGAWCAPGVPALQQAATFKQQGWGGQR